MTLTIDDVVAWTPDQLTAAGDAAARVQRELDAAVTAARTDVAALEWSGATATAATTRMETEQSRASAVGAALLELRTALTAQVANLVEARSTVVTLRDDALNQPGPMPPFQVAPDGTVDARDRIAYLRAHSHLADVEGLVFQEALQAASRTWNLTRALRTAETVAATVRTEVDEAAALLRAAHDGLGEPSLGVPAPDPVPAATAPAAASPASTSADRPSSTLMSGSGDDTPQGTSGTPSATATGPLPATMPTGDQKEWIEEAIRVLRAQGYDISDSDAAIIATIIEKESGGDPHAINLWDSNAAAGIPSKGLMQTIDPTFDSYKLPGHDDIWNPVDNIIAGTRYAIERYGSLGNVPGIVALAGGQNYRGY